jgi:hypothetical protein
MQFVLLFKRLLLVYPNLSWVSISAKIQIISLNFKVIESYLNNSRSNLSAYTTRTYNNECCFWKKNAATKI